jgi:mono/diheme cytochrome c family protein
MNQRWLRTVMLTLVLMLVLPGCAFDKFTPPPVSAALIANARPDHAEVEQLQNGRRLFLSHCLECHTLPPVAKYSRNEWPHLVSRMSARANLSVGEQADVIAYLRAASLTRH